MNETASSADPDRVQAASSARRSAEHPASGQPFAERFARLAFVASATLAGVGLVFAAGMHFEQAKYWPYKPVERALDALGDALEYGAFAPKYVVGDAPPDASREIWKAHVPESELAPGHRAIMGYFRDTADFGVRLYDGTGREVHRRTLNYAVQDPDGPTGGSEAPHAFRFLADGSVLVNTDKGDVLTRYDVCGEPLWSRDGPFHHSFAPDPSGGVWTWLGERSAFDQYQYLVRFDAETGETLEKIGLVEDVIEASPEQRAIFTVVPGERIEHERGYRSIPDTFHPNDIEALSVEMAAAFPDFEAGDLLMSFRNIDLVAVLAPDTREVKWWSHGPWIQQHDPDFLPSGEIGVFNNNNKWPRKTSSIVAMDPSTRAVRTLPVDPEHRFFTQYMGKHEVLDDGTLQVVVPFEGRALEFDAEGRLLLEINNVFGEKHNAFVSDYALLAPDFFDTDPARFTCPGDDASS